MISHLDASIGRIIESLKKSGKYEDTIIVFSADNGLGLGQHGLMGKQNCYEHSVKVPLVFSGPGIPKNQVRDTFVYLMDIFPTLCEMTGIRAPATVEGLSMKAAIENAGAPVRDELFLAYKDKIRGYKTRRYKLLSYKYRKHKTVQLFDLLEDPGETRNLAGRHELAGVQEELTRKTRAAAEAWGDVEHDMGVKFWNDEHSVEPCAWGFTR
jgi:arylsulfatase A-like enzyme